ncbi:MAG: hypothetical protein U9R68_04185, partial [Planctomycetota bacterium]|nr:hypothetical protein [Planctomycetota bacterium]
MTDSNTQPDADDARPPDDADAAGGREDQEGRVPEAEDLTRDRPALAKPEAEDLPVAEPIAEADIPVAEEVAPARARRGSGGVSPSGTTRATGDADDRPLPRPARGASPASTEPVAPAEPKAARAPAASTEPAAPAETGGPDEPPAGRSRRHWGRRFLAAAVVAALLLVVFLPQILSLGPVRQYAVREANRLLPVRVDAADWSLSWFGEQVVEGVEVRSAENRQLAHAGRVTLGSGLLDLAMDHRRLGPVAVDEAEVWVDDLKAALAAPPPAEAPPEWPPEGPPAPPEPAAPPEAPPVTPEPPLPEPPPPEPAPAEPGPAPVIPESVTVRGLVLHVGGDRLRIPDAALRRRDDDRHAFEARLQVTHGKQRGTGAVEGTLTGLSADWQGPDRVGVEAVLTCKDLPLAPGVAAVGAAETDLRVAGVVSGKVTLARSRDARLVVKVDLVGTGLEASGGPLGPDRPAVDTLRLLAEATYDGGAVTVGTLRLTSPVAMARASGPFGLASAEAPPAGKGSAEVRLDLAPLAGMFRHTLGLHEGLTVEGGTFEATVDAVSTEAASRVRLIAGLQDLSGTRGGKTVTLAPLYLDADLVREHPVPGSEAGSESEGEADAAADGEAGPAPAPADWVAMADSLRIDSLVLSGAFGAMEATGRLSHLVLDADLDLARASEEVGRFVDLGGCGGEGTASIHLETGRNLEGDVTAAVRATLKDLLLDLPGGARLRDPRATLSAETVLRFDPQHRLAAAELAAMTLEARTATIT